MPSRKRPRVVAPVGALVDVFRWEAREYERARVQSAPKRDSRHVLVFLAAGAVRVQDLSVVMWRYARAGRGRPDAPYSDDDDELDHEFEDRCERRRKRGARAATPPSSDDESLRDIVVQTFDRRVRPPSPHLNMLALEQALPTAREEVGEADSGITAMLGRLNIERASIAVSSVRNAGVCALRSLMSVLNIGKTRNTEPLAVADATDDSMREGDDERG